MATVLAPAAEDSTAADVGAAALVFEGVGDGEGDAEGGGGGVGCVDGGADADALADAEAEADGVVLGVCEADGVVTGGVVLGVTGGVVWPGAGTASKMRVAPKSRDQRTSAILTFWPLVGALTILPPPT